MICEELMTMAYALRHFASSDVHVIPC